MVADLIVQPKPRASILDIPGCVPHKPFDAEQFWAKMATKAPDVYAERMREKTQADADRAAWNAYLQTPLGKARQAEAQRIWDEPEPEIDTAIAAIMYPNQKADRAILGLDATAIYQKRDVRNAYRRKARKLHPDVGGDAEAFKQLYSAYRAVLKVAKE